MSKKLFKFYFLLFFVALFFQKFQAQETAYKKFKDSLFYGPRVTSLNEVLTNLNTLIRTSSDARKIELYKIKKLHPLIELEQLNNALQLTEDLLKEVDENLEVTVRNRRALIYEFLGDFEKAKKELDLAKQLYNEKKAKKDQEYGALLYRYASLYRVNGRNEEALPYINEAIVFSEKHQYYDVCTVSYLVKALIVNKNNNEAFKNLLLEGLKYARLSKNKFHIRSIYGNLARYYQRKGALKTTLVYTDSILYYDKLLHKSFSGTRSYLIKSECYAALGKPKLALKNYKIFHERTLEEKISKEKVIINELEQNFFLEKEKIIRDQVFKENEIIKKENQNLVWFIASLSILFFSLIIAVIFILKRNKTIKENREQISISNKLLLKGLKEKEVLLKEVHHRVKNNLALIISLVDFQTLEIKSDKEKQKYLALKQRIEAIATLHQQMLGNSDTELNDSYNVKTYLNSIAKSLIGLSAKKVSFVNEIGNIFIPLEVAVPIGILINELISNSLKHHSDDTDIEIRLKILEEKEHLHINYADNGQEFTIKPNRKKSLGLFIIENMVLQLKGTLKRDKTSYEIKVRKQKRAESFSSRR